MADFKLGRIKFKWRGDWATSTAYVVDDIAKYGGNTYVCVINHTSQSTSPGFYTDFTTNSYWQLHTEGLYFKGDWSGSTHYKLNDLVKYGAFQYRTTTQHTSTSTFDETKFEVYSEGLQFEDSYNAGTTYQDGDVVTYGGYSYVWVSNTPGSGVTPIASASEWDLLSPGFSARDEYDNSTAYKTGDVVAFGGWAYVCIVNTTAGTNPTNATYWTKIAEGFKYRSNYSNSTTYYKGDVVRYISSTYVSLAHNNTNNTPDASPIQWGVLAQGDTGAVLSDRGDLLIQGAVVSERLPIGIRGSVLTTDGTDPSWSNAEGANVIYVANSGSDSNPGTQFLPFKTVNHALSQASSGDIVDFDSISGGVGGTPGTYDVSQSSTTGSGINSQIRVVTDGSSTPTIQIINGGSGHAAGDTVTFSGTNIGNSTDLTINVVSASIGDVVYIKNGVYRETLPLRIKSGVTVQGESLRGTEIRPASGNSTQVAAFNPSYTSTVSSGVDGTYNYIHQSSTSGSGLGFIANITVSSGAVSAVTIYHGGFGYQTSDTITFTVADIGCGGSGTLTLTVTTLETNDAANMILLNDTTNLVQMTFKGLTATPSAGGTGKAAVTSLDPTGAILSASPYIQNCSSVNAGATGIQIDGNIHSTGNKSILANDFTQINSDGIGVHALARGRGEMVSIFTYYCAKSFYAHSGGFIRGLNCSSGYGEIGAEADGTDPNESAVNVTTRGEILKYDATTFGGGATESDIADMISTSGQGTATVTGNSSGATATIFRVNISLDYLHIENIVGGPFTDDETVTITKENSSTFEVDLIDTNAQTGQQGPLIAVSSGSTALNAANIINVGTNILFSGDSTYYRVSAVSEEDTSNENALIRLTSSVTSGDAKADNTSADITGNFSNVRLTGHDFLDIGTGDVITSNYPGGPSQPADQADEVNEVNGGRVYFSSTDQKGDFRVGDLFRIEQATGVATLNADAFDLSGLNELQLGSIGAELGATINEFSTDETLGNDSNTAVPTERAIVGYTQRDKMGTGHFVPPTGTTAERPTGGTLYTGGIRFNSTLVTWEGYNGTQWTGLGGGNPWASKSNADSPFTAAANDRYFIDTSGGAVTMNLPAAPLTGDSVRVIDVASTFDTNNLTIGRNGLKINGDTADLTVSTEDAAIGLVYTGATYGWKLVENL